MSSVEASSQQARAFPLLAEDPAKRPGVSTPPSCRPLTRPPCRLLTPHGAPHGSLAAALLPGSFSTVALLGRHGAEADHEGSTPPNLSSCPLFGALRAGAHGPPRGPHAYISPPPSVPVSPHRAPPLTFTCHGGASGKSEGIWVGGGRAEPVGPHRFSPRRTCTPSLPRCPLFPARRRPCRQA